MLAVITPYHHRYSVFVSKYNLKRAARHMLHPDHMQGYERFLYIVLDEQGDKETKKLYERLKPHLEVADARRVCLVDEFRGDY